MTSANVLEPDEFFDAVWKESDRGCVLICAAWIEDLMRTLIHDELEFISDIRRLHVISATELDRGIRDIADGAFGKATNRIAFCRVTGMISRELERALKVLFTLRNKHFAHFAGVSRFNDARIKHLLEDFSEHAKAAFEETGQERKNAARNISRGLNRAYSKSRIKFMHAFSDVACALFDSMAQVMKAQSEAFERESAFLKKVTRQLKSDIKNGKVKPDKNANSRSTNSIDGTVLIRRI